MAIWVHGVCDSLLASVQRWYRQWSLGSVAGTRLFMHKDGREEDVVTKRCVKVMWHQKELEHLVRILKVAKPDWELTHDMEAFAMNGFKRAPLVAGGKGRRVADMVSYFEDVKEILEILTNAKVGRLTSTQMGESIQGGDFWSSVK